MAASFASLKPATTGAAIWDAQMENCTAKPQRRMGFPGNSITPRDVAIAVSWTGSDTQHSPELGTSSGTENSTPKARSSPWQAGSGLPAALVSIRELLNWFSVFPDGFVSTPGAGLRVGLGTLSPRLPGKSESVSHPSAASSQSALGTLLA